jgi:L-ascorbate metabolism protein UlaG (beta-lactamase superfamily)
MASVLTRRWPRSFADRVTGPLPGPPQFLRLWWEGGFAGATSGLSRIPVALRSPLPATGSWLAWLGHASFLLRLGGLTVAVDPVLSQRILGAGQRFTPPGLDRLPPLDLLLISHNHYDHLDAPTLRPLPRGTPVVAPGGLGRWSGAAGSSRSPSWTGGRRFGSARWRSRSCRRTTGAAGACSTTVRPCGVTLSSPRRVGYGCTTPGTAPTARSLPSSNPATLGIDAAMLPIGRIRAALVHARHAHGPDGGRAGCSGRRYPDRGADALRHLPTLP